jgi:hypothetical protein
MSAPQTFLIRPAKLSINVVRYMASFTGWCKLYMFVLNILKICLFCLYKKLLYQRLPVTIISGAVSIIAYGVICKFVGVVAM